MLGFIGSGGGRGDSLFAGKVVVQPVFCIPFYLINERNSPSYFGVIGAIGLTIQGIVNGDYPDLHFCGAWGAFEFEGFSSNSPLLAYCQSFLLRPFLVQVFLLVVFLSGKRMRK